MNRTMVYPQERADDTDILNIGKAAYVGLGWMIEAVLGIGTSVDGLACTPDTGLHVSVAAGAIYALGATDASAFGSLGADAHQLMKQGLSLDAVVLATPAPGSAGQSINYLVQATYADVDAGDAVLPFYNAADPTVPFSGPGNAGTSSHTVREGVCTIAVKAGTAATTGSQTTPAPDAGYVGLYAVTIANGASTVSSGNIVQLATAPFIRVKLPGLAAAIQNNTFVYATDTGAANAMVAAITPTPASLTTGMKAIVKAVATNSGATTLNLNGLGVKAVKVGGSDPTTGMIQAGQICEFIYDGTAWQMISAPSLSGVTCGTPFLYSGTTPPPGAIVRNGATLSRTTYAGLNAIAAAASYAAPWGPGDGSATFTVMDDRGLFDRNYDDSGVISSDAFGTYYVDVEQAHDHFNGLAETTGSPTMMIYQRVSTGVPGNAGDTAHADANTPTRQGSTSTTTAGTGNFGTETAPKRRAYLPCIKY